MLSLNWVAETIGTHILQGKSYITNGKGFYQERRSLSNGDVAVIPSGIEHWHGARAIVTSVILRSAISLQLLWPGWSGMFEPEMD